MSNNITKNYSNYKELIKKYEQKLENMKYLYYACIKENKNLTE